LLKVDLDEPWIADVGFGENFRAPLRMVDGLVQDEEPRAFRLDRDDGDLWSMSTRDAEGLWTPGYRFADLARPIADFTRMCRYHQTSPLSPFTQKPLCSLATPTGRFTLSGNEWIASGLDGSRSVTTIADEAEAQRLLRERFGIAAPGRAVQVTENTR
jgi:N-hydroxyarylamine O-acetyltransferase